MYKLSLNQRTEGEYDTLSEARLAAARLIRSIRPTLSFVEERGWRWNVAGATIYIERE